MDACEKASALWEAMKRMRYGRKEYRKRASYCLFPRAVFPPGALFLHSYEEFPHATPTHMWLPSVSMSWSLLNYVLS
jgi:hypothetical protein